MLYIIISFIFTTSLLIAQDTQKPYQDSKECKPCHVEKVQQWSHSWHANSHYKSDEYLRKSMDYVSRKSRKSLNSVKVQCAVCHNPRINITSTGMDYEIMAVMGLDEHSEVNAAVNNSFLNEGINCLVCHNVDDINTSAPENFRGAHRLTWNKERLISGPLKESHSPHHKTQKRDFFNDKANDLCLTCHANDKTINGLNFINMKNELKSSDKMCVDCHMSERKMGIASNLALDNGKPYARMGRDHGFIGAHTEALWKDALNLKLNSDKNNLLITLENQNPHNIPSGFGARELLIEITYQTDTKMLNTQTVSLTQEYISKRNKTTIPHLAVKISKPNSIPAYASKTLKTPWPKKATTAVVSVYYILVNTQVRTLLDLKDEIWSKKMFISRAKVKK